MKTGFPKYKTTHVTAEGVELLHRAKNNAKLIPLDWNFAERLGQVLAVASDVPQLAARGPDERTVLVKGVVRLRFHPSVKAGVGERLAGLCHPVALSCPVVEAGVDVHVLGLHVVVEKKLPDCPAVS